MRRTIHVAVLATLIATGAAQVAAAAGDLRYEGESLLTESVRGKPYWSLQAQCSGFFGATSNYLDEHGDKAGAETAKTQGVAFFHDALDRLMRDRSIARPEAFQLAAQVVDAGRAEGRQQLENGGVEQRSAWNFLRSTCLDVNEAYKAVRYR